MAEEKEEEEEEDDDDEDYEWEDEENVKELLRVLFDCWGDECTARLLQRAAGDEQLLVDIVNSTPAVVQLLATSGLPFPARYVTHIAHSLTSPCIAKWLTGWPGWLQGTFAAA
jgi:hypothetical protein